MWRMTSICLGLAENTLLILHFSSDDTQPHSILLIIIPGVFRFIKDNFINSPSADLTPELMDMLMAVMLVCYQHVNSPHWFFCILFAPFLRIQLLISSILLSKPARLKKNLDSSLSFGKAAITFWLCPGCILCSTINSMYKPLQIWAPQTRNAKNPLLNGPFKSKPPWGLVLGNCPQIQSKRKQKW